MTHLSIRQAGNGIQWYVIEMIKDVGKIAKVFYSRERANTCVKNMQTTLQNGAFKARIKKA